MSLKAYWDELQKTAAEATPEVAPEAAPEATPAEEGVDKVAAAAELLNSMSEEELGQLFGVEKTAEDASEETEVETSEEDEKVAEDLLVAGRIMAHGFMDALNEASEEK